MHCQVALVASALLAAYAQNDNVESPAEERIRQIASTMAKRFDEITDKGQRVRVFWQSEIHHEDPALSSRWFPRQNGSEEEVMAAARYELLSRRGASRWSVAEGDVTEWQWVFAYDGENAWASAASDSSIQLFRSVGDSPDTKLEEGLPLLDWFSEASGMQPRIRVPTWGISGGLPYPFRLDVALATGKYEITAEDVTLRDSTCIVLEREGLDKVWLDTSRAYAVVQREWNWDVSEPVRIRLENGDLAEVADDLWIPRRFRLVYFGTPETRPEVACLTVNAVVEDYEFAPVSLSFTPDVSPGEHIFDHSTEEYYQAPQESDLDLAKMVTPNGISAEFRKVESESRIGQLRHLILFNFVVLVAIIIYNVWRRRAQ